MIRGFFHFQELLTPLAPQYVWDNTRPLTPIFRTGVGANGMGKMRRFDRNWDFFSPSPEQKLGYIDRILKVNFLKIIFKTGNVCIVMRKKRS